MDKVRILFVYPFPGNIPGQVIDIGESLNDGVPGVTLTELPCHVAVFAQGGLVEAVYPQVTNSLVDRYDNSRTDTIEIEIPDLASFEAAAKDQIGRPYSFLSCAEAELFALTGELVSFNHRGRDCSEVGIICLRAGGLDLLGFESAALVRPSDLLAEMIKQGGVKVEKL